MVSIAGPPVGSLGTVGGSDFDLNPLKPATPTSSKSTIPETRSRRLTITTLCVPHAGTSVSFARPAAHLSVLPSVNRKCEQGIANAGPSVGPSGPNEAFGSGPLPLEPSPPGGNALYTNGSRPVARPRGFSRLWKNPPPGVLQPTGHGPLAIEAPQPGTNFAPPPNL